MDNFKYTFDRALGRISKSFIALLALTVIIFLVLPTFSRSFYTHLALQICFLLLILINIYAINKTPAVLWTAIALIVPFIIFDILCIIEDSLHLMVLAYSFHCLFVLFAIIVLSHRVIAVPIINTNLIFGAIALYMLWGILWAKVYFLIFSLNPSSFSGIDILDLHHDGLRGAYGAQFNLVYYSFTTLTTLGLGDILAKSQLTKSLTILEAVFGQLFIATVVAKMVTSWRRSNPSDPT